MCAAGKTRHGQVLVSGTPGSLLPSRAFHGRGSACCALTLHQGLVPETSGHVTGASRRMFPPACLPVRTQRHQPEVSHKSAVTRGSFPGSKNIQERISAFVPLQGDAALSGRRWHCLVRHRRAQRWLPRPPRGAGGQRSSGTPRTSGRRPVAWSRAHPGEEGMRSATGLHLEGCTPAEPSPPQLHLLLVGSQRPHTHPALLPPLSEHQSASRCSRKHPPSRTCPDPAPDP